ncbi:MAG: hypothetical protein EOP85_07520, partial [Verrucomicrobiaceae bacterium]
MKGVGPDFAGYMERLGEDELRSLIGDLWASGQSEPENIGVSDAAIRAAARELYRREGSAAMEWANNLPLKDGRKLVLKHVIVAAVEDSPAAAKSWVDLFQQKYAMIGENPFREPAFRAAGKKGVDALLEAREVMGDGIGESLVRGPLPDDFDFKRLLTEVRDTNGLNEPLKLWAARDPDVVWKVLKEMDSGEPESAAKYFSSLFDGISQTQGEDAAAKWVAGRLSELPGELRQKALFSLMNTHNMRYQVVNE